VIELCVVVAAAFAVIRKFLLTAICERFDVRIFFECGGEFDCVYFIESSEAVLFVITLRHSEVLLT
jgi:hypothetical protein